MRSRLPALVVATLAAAGCGSAPAKAPSPGPVEASPPSPTPAPSPAPSGAKAPSSTSDDPAAPAGSLPPPSEADLLADVRGSNAFTLEVLGKTKGDRGNVMVSGTSLRQAFGAVYLGARGDTAKEIAKAFELPDDPKKAASAARAELDAWNKARGEAGAELTVANRLWVDRAMPIKPDYASTVEWAFGAAPTNVSFATAPAEARTRVNEWVAEQTHKKIEELIPEGSVDPQTRAVVTNAVYFKGKWVNPFPKGATKDAPFAIDGKKKADVPTMHVTESFGYAHVDKLQLVELSYIGGGVSLLVVLPDDPAGLAKLEASLDADALERFGAKIERKRLALSMPRFGFRWGESVKDLLKELGARAVFTERADLSGISTKPEKLFLSDVFHKTWIAVDEQGTEAAAATGSVVKLASLALGPATEVKIDHPFLFFVRAKGRILFAGRVRSPAREGASP